MKSKFIKGLTIVALVVSVSACEMDRTQRNTAAGAAIGGLAGNWLGGDMGSVAKCKKENAIMMTTTMIVGKNVAIITTITITTTKNTAITMTTMISEK